MKKILILGVNGFIGHHLSQRIMDTTDWEVYGMDMNSERVTDLMQNPRFHFFEGDIMINKEWIEYHVKKCDVILPLVAIATPTLVLVGADDPGTPPAASEIIAAAIPGARLEVIAAASHLCCIEQADVFKRLVGDFLEG